MPRCARAAEGKTPPPCTEIHVRRFADPSFVETEMTYGNAEWPPTGHQPMDEVDEALSRSSTLAPSYA
jgi:hypothetical protein